MAGVASALASNPELEPPKGEGASVEAATPNTETAPASGLEAPKTEPVMLLPPNPELAEVEIAVSAPNTELAVVDATAAPPKTELAEVAATETVVADVLELALLSVLKGAEESEGVEVPKGEALLEVRGEAPKAEAVLVEEVPPPNIEPEDEEGTLEVAKENPVPAEEESTEEASEAPAKGDEAGAVGLQNTDDSVFELPST